MNITYRPEIDGLRAVAVSAVILYHAEINIFGHQPFKGGFIGVDIKFTTSRKRDVKRSYSSIKKIKNHLNWKPLKNVNEENLKKLLEYYENRKRN